MPRQADLSPADMVEVRNVFARVLGDNDGNVTANVVDEILVALEDRGFSLIGPESLIRLERMMKTYGLTKNALGHLSDLLNSS